MTRVDVITEEQFWAELGEGMPADTHVGVAADVCLDMARKHGWVQ